MSYQTLAQKYRPQTFDEVIGQEVITRTLKNSILQKRLANAYIFCGPRGVGKTTVARLVSKAINCEENTSANPCNKCASCREITLATSLDVLEIDGASNNSVDEVRTLRENVKFSPTKGKFKVYIIDEVHMLSQGAFNALLKTLEEPPLHVKFIFATTEPNKVPPTVMSRCQRFDFKRIPAKMIQESILAISKKEKIDIDDEANLVLTRFADGSLRDSLIILDQMVSFCKGKIQVNSVVELLGIVDKDEIFKLTDEVAANNTSGAMHVLDGIIASGKDPMMIVNNLIEHFRNVMIFKSVQGAAANMGFTQEELERLGKLAAKLGLEEIIYILQNLTHTVGIMKQAAFTRAPLELTLIRLTKRSSMLGLDEVLKKLDGMDADEDISIIQPGTENNLDIIQSRAVNENKSRPENKSSSPEETIDSSEISDFKWNLILNYIKNKKMSIFTFLSVARPIEFTREKMVIGFSKDHAFNKEVLETANNKNLIVEAIEKVTELTPLVELVLLDTPSVLRSESAKGEKTVESSTEVKPIIEKAIDIFGGQVVRDFRESK